MPRIFVDFRPAEVIHKKETYVSYYVINPFTGKMTRKRIRCNHVQGKTERLKYARLLCAAVNERLYDGWNPFFEELPNSTVTIRDAICRFLSSRAKILRVSSMKSYRSFSEMFLEWLQLHKIDNAYCVTITQKTLLDYLSWSDSHKNLTNRSYNNYCMFLYTLFDFVKSKGFAAENPAEGLPRRKVDMKTRTVIPKEDRAMIREWFESRIPRYVWAMMLCYRLFIRPKEICGLRIGYIDFASGMLKIPSDLAKNHCDRILGIPDDLMIYFRTLQNYPLQYYIFGNPKTYAPGPKAMAPTRIAERWKEMRDALKLPSSYQFYSLKDTGITEMLEAGVPAKFVKELADHHSLEMTERYTHKSNAKKILEYNTLKF
jgi:integrase